jgi:iron complex transport system substrate-binding protein
MSYFRRAVAPAAAFALLSAPVPGRCYRRGVVSRAVTGGPLAATAAALLLAGCAGTAAPPPGGPAGTVITSTTKIASAGVLGNHRRPDESCATEPARLDPDAPARVRHAAGENTVPSDPRRIVVLAGDELDALCALGLQDRIVAAALPDGSAVQPSYLGTVIHRLPALGTRSSPDLAAVAAAGPDLILGSAALTPDAYPALSAIAPTVLTAAPGAEWRENLLAVGAATGRGQAAAELLAGFDEQARAAGTANDAEHFQASVVQLTDSALRVYGARNFPASVLAAVGVDRPAAQRFTDSPYLEIPLGDSPDFSAAEGDIVYLSFASPAARDRAPELLESAAWRALSANRDNRVFAVNNEVWQSGQGIVAARGIIDDLRWLNAPIN